MSAPKSDSYAQLSDEQKVTFRDSCVNDGVNPQKQCPLCRGRRLRGEPTFRYCSEHKDWELTGSHLWCHRCKVQYRVLARTTEGHDDFTGAGVGT